MLDEKDLQSISNIVKDQVIEARDDIMRGVDVLMEAIFDPQFKLLAEGQQLIREQMRPQEDQEVMDIRI